MLLGSQSVYHECRRQNRQKKIVYGIEIVDGKINDEAVCVVKEVQLFLYIYNMINQQILQAGMKYLFDT